MRFYTTVAGNKSQRINMSLAACLSTQFVLCRCIARYILLHFHCNTTIRWIYFQYNISNISDEKEHQIIMLLCETTKQNSSCFLPCAYLRNVSLVFRQVLSNKWLMTSEVSQLGKKHTAAVLRCPLAAAIVRCETTSRKFKDINGYITQEQ